MKVLITGGHFSPAYSVIEELKNRNADVVIVGRKHPFEGDKKSQAIEFKISKDLNIPFIELETGRLQRKLTKHTIPSIFKSLSGILNSYKILKKEKPDVVLTFGGYLALPIAFVAKLKNIPIVTHEQTQRMGLSNKIISKIASSVCISFESSRKFTTNPNVVLTGNPIRKSAIEVKDKIEHPSNLPVIYITGGSTGSHAINRTITSVINQLVSKYVVIHQTGENEYGDYDEALEFKSSLKLEFKDRYIPRKFIFPTEIGYVYKVADIVIGRSGVNTIIELINLNKPCILIPLPHGQHGEQLLNSKLIKDIGLGEVIEQKSLNEEILMQTIENMLKNIDKYKVSMSIINKYVFPDSARRIVSELTAQYEKKKNKTK